MQCYDATNIIIHALTHASDINSSESIKAALYEIKKYPGVTGKTTFDSRGDVIKPFEIYTIIDNNFIKLQSAH